MIKTTVAIAAVFAMTMGASATFAAKQKSRLITISVTKAGFTPTKVSVKRGESVVLAITRKTKRTCATEIVIRVSKTKTITKELPLDKTVEIPVTFAKSGEIAYACGMGHIRGVIQVQ